MNQVLTWYEFNTEVEKLLARATAAQAVSVARLQKVVRMKWGLDAETIIAHICLTDTRKDDDSATVTVENNRAIIQYNIPDCAPLLLVQINGVWRIDIASYVHDLGDQLQAGIQYCYRSSDVYAATADAVAADRYSSVKEAANALKKATDALEPGQSSEGAH